MADRTYSLSGDFPGGKINARKMEDEIRAAGSGVTTMLNSIGVKGDVVTMRFAAALSAGEATALDGDVTGPAGGLIAAHDNTASLPDTQTVKLDPAEKHTIEIQEVSPGNLTYRAMDFPRISIAAGDSTGSQTKSWSYDYYMLSIEYWGGAGSNAKMGDKITCEIDVDRNLTTLLGALGEVQEAETTADDEVLVAAQAIGAGLLQPGYFVKFAANTNPEYEIISIDTATNKIKLDRNLENNRAAGDDIFRTMTMGRDISVMPASTPVVFGTAKIGASRIPAGWAVKITYDKVAGDTTDGREIDIVPEGGLLAA